MYVGTNTHTHTHTCYGCLLLSVAGAERERGGGRELAGGCAMDKLLTQRRANCSMQFLVLQNIRWMNNRFMDATVRTKSAGRGGAERGAVHCKGNICIARPKNSNCLRSKQKQNNQLSLNCIHRIQFGIHAELI